MSKYYPPEDQMKQFHCIHCAVFAKQKWGILSFGYHSTSKSPISVCQCEHCDQGESVNILLNFTQFFETRIEYRFQIFTAHSCDFLLPSYARLA